MFALKGTVWWVISYGSSAIYDNDGATIVQDRENFVDFVMYNSNAIVDGATIDKNRYQLHFLNENSICYSILYNS